MTINVKIPFVSEQRLRLTLMLFFFISLPIFIFIITYYLPLFVDEGIDFTITQQLLRGDRLYVDIIDNKPPLFFVLLIPITVFANGMVWVIRLFGALLLTTSTALFYKLCRRLFSGYLVIAAVLFWMMLFLSPRPLWTLLLTESMSLPFILGVFLLINSTRKTTSRHSILIGILFAISCFIRHTNTFLVFPILYAWIITKIQLKKMLLGFAMVLIPILLYFTYIGTLAQMLDAIIITPYQSIVGNNNMTVLTGLVFLISFFVFVVQVSRSTPRRHNIAILWLWLIPTASVQMLTSGVGSVSEITPLRLLASHYAIAYFAPLSLLTVKALAYSIRHNKIIGYALATILLISTTYPSLRYLHNIHERTMPFYLMEQRMVDYLSQEESESLLGYPDLAQFNYLSQKEPLSFWANPMLINLRTFRTSGESDSSVILDNVKNDEPELIVLHFGYIYPDGFDSPIEHYLQTNYTPVFISGRYVLYKRV